MPASLALVEFVRRPRAFAFAAELRRLSSPDVLPELRVNDTERGTVVEVPSDRLPHVRLRALARDYEGRLAATREARERLRTAVARADRTRRRVDSQPQMAKTAGELAAPSLVRRALTRGAVPAEATIDDELDALPSDLHEAWLAKVGQVDPVVAIAGDRAALVAGPDDLYLLSSAPAGALVKRIALIEVANVAVDEADEPGSLRLGLHDGSRVTLELAGSHMERSFQGATILNLLVVAAHRRVPVGEGAGAGYGGSRGRPRP